MYSFTLVMSSTTPIEASQTMDRGALCKSSVATRSHKFQLATTGDSREIELPGLEFPGERGIKSGQLNVQFCPKKGTLWKIF